LGRLGGVKPLLIMVAVVGALLFAKAAKFEPIAAGPLEPFVKWTLFIATGIAAVWLAKCKFPAWAAIMAAMCVALNTVAPMQLPAAWEAGFFVGCGVLCAACVVRNWE
jgi:hypothetical protein